jgi:hypothetical protein
MLGRFAPMGLSLNSWAYYTLELDPEIRGPPGKQPFPPYIYIYIYIRISNHTELINVKPILIFKIKSLNLSFGTNFEAMYLSKEKYSQNSKKNYYF